MMAKTGKGQFRPAGLCFRIANASYEYARSAPDTFVERHHLVVGTVFVAFAVEAMLNHYSAIVVVDFDPKEKISRKCAHRRLFDCANLSSYLGGKSYQTINACFDIRDVIAHGDTLENAAFSYTLGQRPEIYAALGAPMGVEAVVTLKKLEEFISAARKIQDDIEENGCYPNSSEKLCECPLDVSGVRVF